MLERWRITSRLIAWISVFMVLCAVGGLPKGPASAVDDHVSQTGELATLPARRIDGPTLDRGPDDDRSTKAPHDDSSWGENVGRTVLSVAPLMSERPDLARIGPSSPRGPPLFV